MYHMLRRVWNTRRLSIRLKALMYQSLVRPVALYGAETWALMPTLERILDTTEMSWLRQLVHVSRWQELTNDEVRRRAQCPVALSEVARQARLRYYGHLSRLPHERAPNRALLRDTPGHRRQGHPPTTWLQLLTMDAATRGLTLQDLASLAPDRNKYRTAVVYAARMDGRPTRAQTRRPQSPRS